MRAHVCCICKSLFHMSLHACVYCSLLRLTAAGHHDAKVLKIDKALAVNVEMLEGPLEVYWILSDAADLLEACKCL